MFEIYVNDFKRTFLSEQLYYYIIIYYIILKISAK